MQKAALVVVFLFLCLLQIDPPYPSTAVLHHLPAFLFLAALAVTLRRFPLSPPSVFALLGFIVLHAIGGRWTYTSVPYDAWSAALLGTSLSELFGWSRNHYDRLVHFAFGALFVLPVAEFLRRHSGFAYEWAVAIGVCFVLAASALYEVFEWLITLVLASETAADYNGQQGDIWDAQKDMALAGLGALISAALAIAAQARRSPASR